MCGTRWGRIFHKAKIIKNKASIKVGRLREIAKCFGLNILSFSPYLDAEEDQRRLESWQQAGCAGEMGYMNRDSHLLTEPKNLFPDLKSIVVVSINYSSQKTTALKSEHGRVARYAWGMDYHLLIKEHLKKLIHELEKELGIQIKARSFTDAVPLLERYYAKQAGLGFIGKSTMLIRPKQGSFFFLAEILSDLEIIGEPLPVLDDHCGTCTNCQTACPTGALDQDYNLDARKCISYLTIEKKGILNKEESEAIGEWIFGCDICQEECPFNHQALQSSIAADFLELDDSIVPRGQLNLKEVLSLRSDQEFVKRFAKSPILRTKREGLLRNAAIVASNTNARNLLAELESCYRTESNVVIKEHARIALEKLS